MVGNWIKSSRKQLGISQEELAARLQVSGFDVSRATVSHWEQGRYAPPLETPDFRQALAAALGLNVRTMLRIAGYEMETPYSETAERVAHLIDQLPPEKQELALRLVEQLAKSG